ncbi:MAG: hypothetical protein P1P82_06640 [Bacteroidales bacterium]|nr:hypothetical protein [Bacteroidales bacterium]MDT8430553.1 hypothetical protein [Bacteroidales bacterium]
MTIYVERRTNPLVELLGYVEEEDIYRMTDNSEPIVLAADPLFLMNVAPAC